MLLLLMMMMITPTSTILVTILTMIITFASFFSINKNEKKMQTKKEFLHWTI